jgi:hypothetical protein
MNVGFFVFSNNPTLSGWTFTSTLQNKKISFVLTLIQIPGNTDLKTVMKSLSQERQTSSGSRECLLLLLLMLLKRGFSS